MDLMAIIIQKVLLKSIIIIIYYMQTLNKQALDLKN
jgi:hypothetical protein